MLNHIFWRDDPPAAQWQPVPTWFERLQHAGVDARAVLPAAFLGSGLTEAAYRGAQFHAANSDDDYAQLVADQLHAAPGLVYAYTAELDTAAHVFGVASPEWHAAAVRVDALLTRLVEALPSDAALLITADHGGLNVPADQRIDLDADPRLSAGVRAVAGDPRVRYLHTEPGAASDVIAAWSELLNGRADVHSRDDAVAAGLFGPVRPDHLPRIGDVVVTCTGDTAVLASGSRATGSGSTRRLPWRGHPGRDGDPADHLPGLTSATCKKLAEFLRIVRMTLTARFTARRRPGFFSRWDATWPLTRSAGNGRHCLGCGPP